MSFRSVRSLIRVSLLGGLLLCGTAGAGPQAFQVRVGETKTFTVNNAMGVVLDDARVADVALVRAGQVTVSGTKAGKAQIEVFSAQGAVQSISLTVQANGGQMRVSKQSPYASGAWTTAQLGGRRFEEVACAGDDLPDEVERALKEARQLLAERDVRPAIPKLQALLAMNPRPAVAHIFLGAAYERSNDPARGVAEYETYVLSCEDDSLTPPLIGVLKDYMQRTGKGVPVSKAKVNRKKTDRVLAAALTTKRKNRKSLSIAKLKTASAVKPQKRVRRET
jgi:hypothetical protein